jgi:anaerobic dimethyl sulfoxide reductase subunit B (iron-sulfur subunit)
VPAGPASYLRMITTEKGKYPDISISYMFAPCYHCAKPACVSSCPADAITKREEDGVVVVDREACLGQDDCGLCQEACPYDAPQFGAEENATMQKCNLCLDRLAENKQPICVDACIMHVLDAGPIEELQAKYGNIRQAEGCAYSDQLIPSIVFKPKKEAAKGLTIEKIAVSPPK